MSKIADLSENEDDPAVYESSGSEWNSETELEPVRKSTRRSSRVSKKTRRKSESSSSESEEEEEEEPKPRKRNGVNKKQKIDTPEKPESVIRNVEKTINSKDFSTGSFLILKKDARVGDPKKHPCIWRVDGKALLQKYEPFEENGKIRHKTTSIYTGWSALDRDLYAPVAVSVTQQNNQTLIVDLEWDKLKEIDLDSD